MRLTGTGTRTGLATTDLIWDCVIIRSPLLLMHLPLLSIRPFYPDDFSLPFFSAPFCLNRMIAIFIAGIFLFVTLFPVDDSAHTMYYSVLS